MKLLTITLLFLVTYQPSLLAVEQSERHIHVNGEHLDSQNIALLDQLTGNQTPNGYYWINMQTGEWGFENNAQVQGIIQTIANYQQQNAQQHYQAGQSDQSADGYNDWEGVDQNGSVVSGRVNGQDCTYVSSGGMTFKSCD